MVPFKVRAGGLAATGGQVNCFPIDVTIRGILTTIIITQVSGVQAGFTWALFDDEQACSGFAGSDSLVEGPGDSTGDLPDEISRVTPDRSTAGNTDEYFADQAPGGHGYTFVSRFDHSKNTFSRRAYLKIAPGGSGAKEFAISIAGESYGG
jgi:hypothetical protein